MDSQNQNQNQSLALKTPQYPKHLIHITLNNSNQNCIKRNLTILQVAIACLDTHIQTNSKRQMINNWVNLAKLIKQHSSQPYLKLNHKQSLEFMRASIMPNVLTY